MSNLIVTVHERVLDKLVPILEPLSDFAPVVQISTQDFNGTAEMDDLLERFRDALPAAYLSVPRITYDTNPSSLRVINVTLNYAFMVAFADRRSEEIKQAWAMEFHDLLNRLLALQTISDEGIPCAGLDFIRPQEFEYAAAPGAEELTSLSAILYQFSIEVRSWEINTPE